MSSSLLPRLLPRSARASTSATPSTSSRSIRRRMSTTTSVRQQPSAPASFDASTPDLPPPSDTFERAAPPHAGVQPVTPPPQANTDSPQEGRMVAPDMQDFLRGYPLVTKNRWHQQNASFYANEQLATPSEWTIEDLLSRLRKDPSRFKNNHAAWEWLFPVPEAATNLDCWRLQPHEVEAISNSPLSLNRLVRAYDSALRVYGIILADRQTGLLRAGPLFKSSAHLILDPPHPLRLSRLLKSLTLLSPTSGIFQNASLLHHVASLPLFLLAHHNDATPGFPDLSPSTPGGDLLELRWSLCFRDKAFRGAVNALVMRRRGTAAWEAEQGRDVEGEKEGEGRWGVKRYEKWCVAREAMVEGVDGVEGGVIDVAGAIKRGRNLRKYEEAWLAEEETKKVFLTPSKITRVRKAPVQNVSGPGTREIYDADAWEHEGEAAEMGEWEEVTEYSAEADGLRDVERERDEEEERKEEEELAALVGREAERADEEDEEGGYTILQEEVRK